MLLSYENEAIFAQQNGQDIDYVVPDQTILIENPVAVTANSANPESAKAWLDYVYTPEAQKIFADNGYRPVVSGVVPDDQFPTPTGLFTIDGPRWLAGRGDEVLRHQDRHRRHHRAGQRGGRCLLATRQSSRCRRSSLRRHRRARRTAQARG